MAGWTRGYVADSTYGIAWQSAQTPGHLAMVCAMAGVAWEPRPRMVVADLGCGRGYTVNTLAAANPDWTVLGLDHNPVHVAEAMQTASRSGLGNALFQEADLGAMTDAELEMLPPLDVVMLHGVWSWVSDAVREGILRLLARRLKPGGIAYVGYNALPGAGADFPLQRLLKHLAGPLSNSPGAGEAAAGLAIQRLRAIAPELPLRQTPMLKRLLADPPVLEPGFIAHEFLTDHWRPVFHEDLCAALAPAKLQFVGSCNLFEALPNLFCEAPEMALMAAWPEGAPRELLKDLYLPRPFRADVFIRGARPGNAETALESLIIAACRPLPAQSPSLGTGRAQAVLAEPFWTLLVAALAEGPISLGHLRGRLGERVPHAAELLALLVGTEHVLPVFRAPERAAAATRFNLAAAAIHAPGGEGAGHFALASPVAAGGLPASAMDLALVAALLEGADPDDPEAIARGLQPGLDLADAAQRIAATLAAQIPIWQRFGVI